jgi:hypothetical protein
MIKSYLTFAASTIPLDGKALQLKITPGEGSKDINL